eukprot:2719548-Amphidinium_carterae.1
MYTSLFLHTLLKSEKGSPFWGVCEGQNRKSFCACQQDQNPKDEQSYDFWETFTWLGDHVIVATKCATCWARLPHGPHTPCKRPAGSKHTWNIFLQVTYTGQTCCRTASRTKQFMRRSHLPSTSSCDSLLQHLLTTQPPFTLWVDKQMAVIVRDTKPSARMNSSRSPTHTIKTHQVEPPTSSPQWQSW